MFRHFLPKVTSAFFIIQNDSMRDQILGHYENRVRAYSHPRKVFQYFASIDNEFMKIEDFIKSLIPYNVKDHVTRNTKINIPSNSSLLLADLNKDGLISFDEYIFYLSLLTLPSRSLKSAFHLFDKNHNNAVDEEELQDMLATFARKNAGFISRMGIQQQATNATSFSLIKHLFGDKETVQFKEFEQFVKLLKTDLLKIEFDMYSNNKGSINIKDFAYILTNYAHPKVQVELGDRINKLPPCNYAMNLNEFLSFHDALSNTEEFDYALSLFLKAKGAATLNTEELAHVFKIATNRVLKKQEVDMIYSVFRSTTNNDGFDPKLLSSTLKRRRFRGLNEHRDTGFTRFFNNFVECLSQ